MSCSGLDGSYMMLSIVLYKGVDQMQTSVDDDRRAVMTARRYEATWHVFVASGHRDVAVVVLSLPRRSRSVLSDCPSMALTMTT
jgi:hypothetical protein